MLKYCLEMGNKYMTLHPLQNLDGDFYVRVINRQYAIGEENGKKRRLATHNLVTNASAAWTFWSVTLRAMTRF